MNNNDYCLNKAAPPGSNLHYCFLYYPEKLKSSLHILHAFANEVGDILLECSDPGVARMKLHWWHEEIQRIYEGQARHPVSKAIVSLIQPYSLEEQSLHQLVRYNEQILDIHHIKSHDNLSKVLQQGPGLIWQLTAGMCGFRDPSTSEFANKTGCLIFAYEYLQNIFRHMATNGQLLWPEDEIIKAGLSPADFINAYTEEVHDFLIRQIKTTIQDLDKIYKEFPEKDRRSQLCCLIINRLVQSHCKEIVKDNTNLQRQKLILTPLQKLWISWRTKHDTYRKH